MGKLDKERYKYYDEIPKHRRRKNKSAKKSDHKHIYKDILAKHDGRYVREERCEICGKTGLIRYFESERTESGNYRVLTSEEILEKYKDLEMK